MTAEWTTPITWEVDQLVTADNLNEQVRDNLDYLLIPNHERIIRDNGSDYVITSVTSFQDVDGTNLSIELETHGGPVLVHFSGVCSLNAGETVYFDIAVDGTRVGDAYTLGLAEFTTGATDASLKNVDITIVLTGLSAGTYELRPQWRTLSGDSIALRATTSTHPVIFEAIEL